MDWKLVITTFITLVVIFDPVGNIPVYLSLTHEAEERGRRRYADQAVMAATAVIFVFAFFGRYILDYLSISIESLSVAGGILLGMVALDMMKGKLGSHGAASTKVGLVPLGTPLLAGPGAVVAAMLIMSGQQTVLGRILVASGIIAALLAVWISFRLAERLLRLLRDEGVDLLTRVMGILLAAIGVEFIHQAVSSWTS